MKLIINADSEDVALMAVKAAFATKDGGSDLQGIRFSDGSLFAVKRNKASVTVWPQSLSVDAPAAAPASGCWRA